MDITKQLLLLITLTLSSLLQAAGVSISLESGADVCLVSSDCDVATRAQWGIGIRDMGNRYDDQTLFNSMLSYEYDYRVEYNNKVSSITDFWRGCAGYFGQQSLCPSDFSVNTISSLSNVHETIAALGVPVKNNNGYVEAGGEIAQGFKMHLTQKDIESLGDFYQLGYRQAIRFQWNTYSFDDDFNIFDLAIPLSIESLHPDLAIDYKIIIRLMAYPADTALIECQYSPDRPLLNKTAEDICQTHYSHDIEIQSLDDLADYRVRELFPEGKNNRTSSVDMNITIGELLSQQPSHLGEDMNIILHYEVQYSFINANMASDYNAADYLDRIIPPARKVSSGSLYYCVFLLSFLLIRRKSRKVIT